MLVRSAIWLPGRLWLPDAVVMLIMVTPLEPCHAADRVSWMGSWDLCAGVTGPQGAVS